MSQPFDCQHCGAMVPAGAAACPECGADEQTGWSPQANLLLPADDPERDLLGVGGRREDVAPPTQRGRLAMRAVVALVLASLVLPLAGPWGALAALLAGAALIWYAERGGVALPARPDSERQLYRQLLDQTRGDEAMAERLLEAEARRTPAATRRQLLEAALYRLRR